MICYMLIMNMPLWITVYLRNKWCLNLESWILEDSWLRDCNCQGCDYPMESSLRSWIALSFNNVFCPWVNSLQWRHNERNGVSNHQPRDCLLSRVIRNMLPFDDAIMFKIWNKRGLPPPSWWRHRASQITAKSTICSAVCSGHQQRNCKSSALLRLCEGKPPFTVEHFTCHDVINVSQGILCVVKRCQELQKQY